jgi:Flp pilus assembly protein TadD
MRARRAPARKRASRPHRHSSPITTGLVAVALVALAFWTYATSFRGVFVLDDIPAVAQNPTIRTLWPPSSALSPPADSTVSGRPLANLTFALNYALAPSDVREAMHPVDGEAFYRNIRGYHGVNLAIHALAALVLFGIARRTLRTPALGGSLEGAETGVAFVIAAVWVVHPLHTQAVTYVVQRVESAMGLCYMLTLYCAIRATTDVKRRRLWNGAAVAACAAGMMFKEVMIIAPVVVWVWDRMFLKPAPEDAREFRRWSLYGGLVATLAIPISIALVSETQGLTALRLMVTPERGAADAIEQTWTPWSYLLTQAGVILHYTRQAVYPSSLVFDYYDWPQARGLVSVLPSVATMVAVGAAVLFGIVQRLPAAFPGAWFLLTLAPTSSIIPIPTEVAAEHRMYLPLAGLVALAVGGTWLGLVTMGRRLSGRPATRWTQILGLATAVVLIVTSSGLTSERNEDYWSEERLWQDTVQKRPGNARARINYGVTLMATGRYREAEAQMNHAVALPADRATAAQALLQLGGALSAQGHFEDGERRLRRALELDPTVWEAHMILGQSASERGDVRGAIDHLLQAVAHRPREVMLLNRATWLLATSVADGVRNGSLAVELGERALELSRGQNEATLVSLAAAYAEAGRFDDATATAGRALAAARQRGDRDAAATIAQHLALYERRVKLRVRGDAEGAGR